MSPFTGLLATFAALCNAVTFMYRFSGIIAASLLRAALGQHLYFLVIRQRQLFWSKFSGAKFFLGVQKLSSFIPYICELYITVDYITVVYSRWDLHAKGSHINTISCVSILYAVSFFSTARDVCGYYIIFKFIYIPSTQSFIFFYLHSCTSDINYKYQVFAGVSFSPYKVH